MRQFRRTYPAGAAVFAFRTTLDLVPIRRSPCVCGARLKQQGHLEAGDARQENFPIRCLSGCGGRFNIPWQACARGRKCCHAPARPRVPRLEHTSRRLFELGLPGRREFREFRSTRHLQLASASGEFLPQISTLPADSQAPAALATASAFRVTPRLEHQPRYRRHCSEHVPREIYL